jgi:cell division transport system permease protein
VRAVRYSVQEALITLTRAGRSTLMSIGTVGSTAEMSVFLRDDADEATRGQLGSDLGAHPAVEHVEYVSKEQAIARFRSDFPELSDVTDSGSNPFPASLELRLRADAESAAAADALAGQLRQRAGVADVRYDREWIARLQTVVTGLRLAGLIIAGTLVLGAAFTVAAVVRLSLFTRRDEIEIMRLVGAPFAFIRGPSVAEGTAIGGAGAVVALLLLYVLYRSFKLRLSEALATLMTGGELQFLGVTEAGLMVLAALLLGGLTGLTVSRSIR